MVRRWIKRVGGWVRRPVGSGVLVLVLAMDVWMVMGAPGPRTSWGGEMLWWGVHRWRMSPVERRVVREVGRGALEGGGLKEGLFVVRGEDPAEPLRLIDQDAESWDVLSGLLTASPHRLAEVSAEYGSRRRGVWGLTREDRVDVVSVRPMERGGFDGVGSSRVRGLLAAHGWGGAAAGAADQSGSRILLTGYLHNVVVLGALAMLVWSLGWVREVPRRVRGWRGRRRVRRGVCPGCGYPLRGLEGGPCPECGVSARDWVQGKRSVREGAGTP